MAGTARVLFALFVVLLPVVGGLAPQRAAGAASIDPAVRDRAIDASVELAIQIRFENGSVRFTDHFPLGSGTVVSPNGLILTNAHLADRDEQRATIEGFERELRQTYPDVQLTLDESVFVVLTSNGVRPPEAAFTAETVVIDPDVDLAVLQVVGDENGRPFDRASLRLPFLPIGDSDQLRLGDAVHLFTYPGIADGALTYTTGVVSGFGFDPAIDGVAWIRTDAVMSGGSSGGTAIDDAGNLIGVPTRGSALDCRPGDTNGDGTVDATDVGCVPTGGSLGELRPVNLALPLLARALDATGTNAAAPTEPAATAPPVATTAPGFPPLPLGGSDDSTQGASPTEPAAPTAEPPVATSVPEPPPTQVAGSDDQDLGVDVLMRQTFDDVPDEVVGESSGVQIGRGDGTLVMTVVQPGSWDTLFFNDAPTGDRDFGFAVQVADTTGWGEILLQLGADRDDSDDTIWTVAVNPQEQTWAMYRSAADGALFYWVNPRDFSSLVGDPVSTIEVQVAGGVPRLLVNGTDVSTPTGIDMPRIPGSQIAGFGAGVNDGGRPGSAAAFSVEFDTIVIYALP